MNFTETYIDLIDRVIVTVNAPFSVKNLSSLKILMEEVMNFVLSTSDEDESNFENMTTHDCREMMVIQYGYLLSVKTKILMKMGVINEA